jgi:hypothetical protein
MRGLVGGCAGFNQPVKHDRDDHNTSADADQAGEHTGSRARNHAQDDEPKGAHVLPFVR